MSCACGAPAAVDCCFRSGDLGQPARGCLDPDYGDYLPAGTRLQFEPIEEFVSVVEEGAEPLVLAAGSEAQLRAAVPAGGLVLVYGDGGSGKTTKLIDWAMHFAAGLEWCSVLTPARPLRIAWIENEGPRPMMRAKLAAKLEAWTGPSIDGRIRVLTEPWSHFTFRDGSQRDELVASLDDMQADLLIVGPLSRIGMEGGGTSDDIRAFLRHVEDVQNACRYKPAVTIVHHENRSGQVSGTWEREPDLLVHVRGQGHGRTRLYWQKARWASDLHGTSTQLIWADGESFTVDDKPEVTVDTMAADIVAAVRDMPGSSWTSLRNHITGNLTEAATVRDQLVRDGVIVNNSARRGHFNLWLPDIPEATRSGLGTGPERLSFPTPASAPDPSRSPVPYVGRNGERNGTGDPGSHVDPDEVEWWADRAREALA